MKAALLSIALLVSTSARAESLSGSWSAPFGTLALTQKGDEVTATASQRCPAPASGHVLEGDLLEDSLSGQVYLCLEGCAKGPSWVPVLLLVGGDGQTLSGTSTLPKGCKAQVGPNGSLILKRRAPGETAEAKVAKAEAPAPTPSKPVPPLAPPPPETPPDNGVAAPAAAQSSKPKRPKSHPTSAPTSAPVPVVAQAPAPAQAKEKEDPQLREKAIEIARDGANFQQEGKFEQARKRFQEAIAVDPYYAEGFNGVGVTFFARNDLSEALRWYKKALGADPSFGDAYYNMACVYALQKRKALALRYLKIAFHNGFTSREAMRDDQDLASLHGDKTFEALLGEAP